MPNQEYDVVREAEGVAKRYSLHRGQYCIAGGHIKSAIKSLEAALKKCRSCPHKDSPLPRLIDGFLKDLHKGGT